MADKLIEPQTVLDFWFVEIDEACWFRKDESFDAVIRERFGELHHRAVRGELFRWRQTPEGRLAEIIVLDQFSRNIYRDHPLAFAWDGMALSLAQEAVARGQDRLLSASWRVFLYMPYMHSESRVIHDEAERLFAQAGLEDNYRFELRHKEIIARFGRYPHRNQILGRPSTPDELSFLTMPGSSF
ncbi:MAG: DUF924 domain-containing protein [Hahellaceae bacterium]|nr:DUF924 domain-containing protein [Hahellaceae bacterium]